MKWPHSFRDTSLKDHYRRNSLNSSISISEIGLLVKNLSLGLAGIAKWLEHRPMNPRVVGLIPVKST